MRLTDYLNEMADEISIEGITVTKKFIKQAKKKLKGDEKGFMSIMRQRIKGMDKNDEHRLLAAFKES